MLRPRSASRVTRRTKTRSLLGRSTSSNSKRGSSIAGPLAFNKGVLYLLLATPASRSGSCCTSPRHMQQAPRAPAGRGRDGSTASRARSRGENIDDEAGQAQVLPVDRTLFVFILVSNLIGYIPLPVDSGQNVQAVRRAHPVVPDLRRGHERRLPADPRARCVRRYSTRRSQAPRADRLHQKPDARRASEAPIVGADLPDRDPLELPAPDLADDPAVGEPARRPSADRVHGRRASACSWELQLLGWFTAAARGRRSICSRPS